MWAIAADKVFTVMRSDISITANPFFYFGSDSTAVRGTMRLGYGFPHAAAVEDQRFAGIVTCTKSVQSPSSWRRVAVVA